MFSNWDSFRPSRIIMHPLDWRDIRIWSLIEEGMPEDEARAQVGREMEQMAFASAMREEMERIWA